MYRKIRIVVASLVVMAMCVLSSVGTLAYFTDTDSKSNEFTIGNASSELSIFKDANGTPFSTNSLSPLTDNMSDIPYYLQAENTGNIPVYQRFRVVIPIALEGAITLGLPCTLGSLVDDVRTCDSDDYTVKYDSSVDVENTPTYAVYYITSKSPLGVGQKTAEWPVTAIKVGNISSVENLDNVTQCDNNDANNCTFGIRAYSDVIQTTISGVAASAFDGFTETY